jgi:hypothetical protein
MGAGVARFACNETPPHGEERATSRASRTMNGAWPSQANGLAIRRRRGVRTPPLRMRAEPESPRCGNYLRQQLLALRLRVIAGHGGGETLEDAVIEGSDDGVVDIALATDRRRVRQFIREHYPDPSCRPARRAPQYAATCQCYYQRSGIPAREPVNSEASVDVRFGAHSGLTSDIAQDPESAQPDVRPCPMRESRA